MKYIGLILIVLFFASCSSKSAPSINTHINSFSLDKNIQIAFVPRTVNAPFSVGLGIGTFSRHMGVNVGTVFTPEFSNDEALNLEKAINLNSVSLGEIISLEFDRQMATDAFYKDKYIGFGGDYTIHLFVQRYYLDTANFNDKASPKVVIEITIVNKSGSVVYNDAQENDTLSRYYNFSESEIYNSKEILEKALRDSVANCIAKLIFNMKKD